MMRSSFSMRRRTRPRADENVPHPAGFGPRWFVTGDVTQIDLPGGARSGLRAAVDILDDIDDIHFAELTSVDVVPHRLVSEIVDAYAKYEEPGLGLNRAARRASGVRSRR